MTLIGTSMSATQPICFAQDRRGIVYGVSGYERGFRWTGSGDIAQIGITAPTSKPTVTVTTKSPKYFVSRIDVVSPGAGYRQEPTISLSGGGGSGAKAKASLLDGRVHRVTMQDYGSGYTGAPAISVTAPPADQVAASVTPKFSGSVVDISITSTDANFTEPPTVKFSGGGTGAEQASALAFVSLDDCEGTGPVTSIVLTNAGAGYTEPPTITLSGGGGSATAKPVMDYTVTSVTVNGGGAGYGLGEYPVEFRSADGGGAAAVAAASGAVLSIEMLSGGSFRKPSATATVPLVGVEINRPPVLRPVMVPEIRPGKYWCAIRYTDNTPQGDGGPYVSSISELTEVDVGSPGELFNWSWSNAGAEARVANIELWRTTSDQALVLYRVATVPAGTTAYADAVGDNQLIDRSRTSGGQKVFAALPIVLPNGQVNARRFHPPPQNRAVMVMFQDRAWYGVDVPGRTYTGASSSTAASPNALYFSEVDEPESVPPTNQVVLQDNINGTDQITALMPFGGGMVVFQNRHAYRMSYVAQPVIDASVALIAQRGCLSQRCWDINDSIAYVVDGLGMYTLSGETVTPISGPVGDYWSEGKIHFPSSKWFFVRVDPVTRVARFFFCESAGYPDRALCYHPGTQAWWLEAYAQTFSSSATVLSGGRPRSVVGGQAGGIFLHDSGGSDVAANGDSAAVACAFRTGPMPFKVGENDRAIRILYKPTAADCHLSLGLHYNNASTPRGAAVATDTGTGWTTDAGGGATLNLKAGRSALGEATGYATARYAGRVDDRSAGGDRHVAVAVGFTAPSTEKVVLHGVAVSGVGA